MNKKTKNILELFASCLIFAGFIFIFCSIWVDGWAILRLAITGILLLVWGSSIWKNAQRKTK